MDPLVYSYIVGGAVFCVGLVYAAKQGYIGLSASGIRNLLACLLVIGFFLVIQSYLQYAPMEAAPKAANAVAAPQSPIARSRFSCRGRLARWWPIDKDGRILLSA